MNETEEQIKETMEKYVEILDSETELTDTELRKVISDLCFCFGEFINWFAHYKEKVQKLGDFVPEVNEEKLELINPKMVGVGRELINKLPNAKKEELESDSMFL